MTVNYVNVYVLTVIDAMCPKNAKIVIMIIEMHINKIFKTMFTLTTSHTIMYQIIYFISSSQWMYSFPPLLLFF